MKALTLHQPWASLVAIGVKTIETRSWKTAYRGPLAIHAATRKPAVIWSQDDVPDVADPIAIEHCWNIWEDPHNPGQYGYEWRGPLGAVVATCTLVDVVPIIGAKEPIAEAWAPHVADGQGDGRLRLWKGASETEALSTGRKTWLIDIIEDQRRYGDFAPGRWAWLLDDIKPLDEPIPAKGRQGLWEWQQS